jgi:hypothetical protein
MAGTAQAPVCTGRSSVDTCQAFSIVRMDPRAGMIAARLSESVRPRGKSFGRMASHIGSR